MPGDKLDFIKTVKRGGKSYLYFSTGMKRNGKTVYSRLPPLNDLSFGTAYATAKGLRTKRENRQAMLTMGELVGRYERAPKFTRRSEGTQRTYGFYLNRARDKMGQVPIVEIERSDIREFLLEGLKPTAQRMMVMVVHILYKFAIANDWAEKDPTVGIEIDYESEPHEPWPDPLLTAALKDPAVKLPVALLYFTGQRISDVCAMHWSHVSDDEILVTVRKTKTSIKVAIHEDLQAILNAETRGLTTILHDKRGRPVKPDTLRLRLQRWAKEKGFEIVPHGLRKNAVNALLEAECTAAQVSAITGQSLQMVEHYARARDTTKLGKQAVRKWERKR